MAFWINFILLVVIQSVDMLLTERYIGSDWTKESFPLMSLMIRDFGINPALWVCRLSTYSFLFCCLRFRKHSWITDFLTILNLCYWTSMISWLFNLNLVDWPVR